MDEEKQQGVDTSASFSDCLKICTSSKFGVRPIPLCQSRWQSSFYSFPPSYPKKKKKKKSDFRLCQSLFLYSLVSFRFYTRNFSLCYTDPSGNFVLEMALIVWSWERSLESFLTASYKVPRVCVPVYFTTILNSFFFSSQLDGFFNLILSFMRYLVSRCRSVSSSSFFFFSGYKENILSRLVRKEEGYIRKF